MQPANIALSIVRGATLSESIRVMQSHLEYRPISKISDTAPVRLSVNHGLPKDWPVYVQGVQGFQELNRTVTNGALMAAVVDTDTLEINAVSAVGRKANGGMLVYHPPVDLTGAVAVMQVLDEKGGVLLEMSPVVHPGGWIDIKLTAEQTASLDWRLGWWLLNATMPNGEVIPLFVGTVEVAQPGFAPKPSAISSNWVFTFGTQGPAGAGDVSELLARLDAQQQQIEELFALIEGGGETPVFVLSGEANVMSGDHFVVSSGVH